MKFVFVELGLIVGTNCKLVSLTFIRGNSSLVFGLIVPSTSNNMNDFNMLLVLCGFVKSPLR